MVNLWATSAGAHHLKYRKGIVIDIHLANWNVLWLLGIYLPFQNFQMQKELERHFKGRIIHPSQTLQASYIMSVWTYMMSSDPCGSKKLKPIVKPCCQQWLQHPEKKLVLARLLYLFLLLRLPEDLAPTVKASNSHSTILSHSAQKKKGTHLLGAESDLEREPFRRLRLRKQLFHVESM